jgi:hypothetical protein
MRGPADVEADAVNTGRLAGWVIVAALASVPFVRADAREREPGGSFLHHLLGPVAGIAANYQWVRVNDALRAGRPELALVRAETALALDPGATEGWKFLCSSLAYDLASANREPDLERRVLWIRTALDLAARGETKARDPAELALWQGLVRAMVAESGDPPWPGGPAALWSEAVEDFERCASLGHPDGEDLAAGARAKLALASGG